MQTGVFYCMRAAGRHMLPRKSGSVVNISSIRGFSPNTGRMTYCAPKAAVIMMTKVAAGEWAPHGRARQRDLPGRPAHADVGRRRGARRDRRAVLPRRRSGAPARHASEEVGKLAVYLSSDDASVHHRRRADDRRRADVDPGGMTSPGREGRNEGMDRTRRLAIAAALALLVALLAVAAGCGGSEEAAPPAAEPPRRAGTRRAGTCRVGTAG